MRTRRLGARNKELGDQRIKLRVWQRWRRERFNALLSGPYGLPAQALLRILKTSSGPTSLIDCVASGPWANADPETRFEILSLIDAVITKRREHMGMPPFNDSLPAQPENAFLILRARLGGEFPA
jgi:hypothetical protein